MDTNKYTVPNMLYQGYHVPMYIPSLNHWRRMFLGEIKEFEWLGPRFAEAGYTYPGDYFMFMRANERLYKKRVCGLCHGAGARLDEFGDYYCLCHLLNVRDNTIDGVPPVREQFQKYTSSWAPLPLDTMQTDGMLAPKKAVIQNMIDKAQNWIGYPDRSLILSGPTGVGKTRVLYGIMNVWYPWAAYLTAFDLQDYINGAFPGGQYEGKKSEMLHQWKNTPILCLDDLGTQYASPWMLQIIEDILSYRLDESRHLDRLTVIATNVRRNEQDKFAREGVNRLGSRLNSKQVEWIQINNADDFRLRR